MENSESGLSTSFPGDRFIERWREQRRELVCLLELARLAHWPDLAAELPRDGFAARAGEKGGLNGLRQAIQEAGPPLEPSIRLLCQVLLDYLSAGHFTVFHRLLVQPVGGGRIDQEALLGIYRLIECTTDHALRFNDKYDTDAASLRAEQNLGGDLSRLHRVLRIRFQLEDLWLEMLMV